MAPPVSYFDMPAGALTSESYLGLMNVNSAGRVGVAKMSMGSRNVATSNTYYGKMDGNLGIVSS